MKLPLRRPRIRSIWILPKFFILILVSQGLGTSWSQVREFASEPLVLKAPFAALIDGKAGSIRDDQAWIDIPGLEVMDLEAVEFDLVRVGSAPLDIERVLLGVRINGRQLSGEQLETARAKSTAKGGSVVFLHLPVSGVAEASVQIPDFGAFDETRSHFTLRGTRAAREWTLAMLGRSFAAKAVFEPTVHFCFPGFEKNGLEVQELGSLITQAIALRMGKAMPRVSHSNQIEEGLDTIVVGDRSSVVEYLMHPDEARKGAYLEVSEHPTTPGKFLLVVTGNEMAEIRDAATMLGLLWSPLPESSGFGLSRLSFPEEPVHIVRGPVYPGQNTTIHAIGGQRQSVYPKKNEEFFYDLNLAPQVPFEGSKRLDLSLHLSHTSREYQSVELSMYVNGEKRRSKRFSLPPGAENSTQSWSIPVSDFRAGNNQLILQPSLDSGDAENFRLTLDSTSTLSVPGPSREIWHPDLGLLGTTGHPFAERPDGSQVQFIVPGQEGDAVEAMWLFAGRIAKSSQTLLYRAGYGDHSISDREHRIVVGHLDLLPEDIFRGGDLSRDDFKDLTALMAKANKGQSGLVRAARFAADRLAGESSVPDNWSLSSEGILYQFERQMAGDGYETTTVLMAGATGDLSQISMALTSETVWEGLQGEVFIWSPSDQTKSYGGQLSDPSKRQGSYYDSRLPYLLDLRFGQWIAWIAGVLIVTVVLGRIALGYIYRNRSA